MPFFYRDVMLTSDGKGHYLLHFTPRWSCELSNLQTWQLCSFFLAVERARKNVCRHDLPKFQLLETQCNKCYSCWCTMDSCSRVLKIVFKFSVSLYSRFNFLPLLNASIEGNVKKTALERICEWNVVLWKIPPRTPLAQKGLPHFTQAQSNRNKDFVVPVLDSSRASVAGSSGQG